MDDIKTIRARFEERRREAIAHYEAVAAEFGPNTKVTTSLTCSACGGYVQKPAVYLCEKYSDILGEATYCIYCLSRLLNRSVEDLKAEYKANM